MAYALDTLQNAAAATGNGTEIDVRNYPRVGIHFVNTGSPNGTVTFEGTIDETNWIAVPVKSVTTPDGTLVTTATAAGYFRLPSDHGLAKFRARISTYNSGNFTIVAGRAR